MVRLYPLARLYHTCKSYEARWVPWRSKTSRVYIYSVGKEVLVLESICLFEENGRVAITSLIAGCCHLGKKGN